MLKRFLSYYKPHKRLFIFVLFIDLLISLIAMAYPIITREMINNFIPNGRINYIIGFGLLLLVLYSIKAILKYYFDYLGHLVGTRMQANMRSQLFAKYEKLPFTYYDNNDTGKTMSRMTTDLFEIAELAHHGPETLFMALVTFVFSAFYLSSISLTLTLIIFSCVPIMAVTTSTLRKKHMLSSKKAKAANSIINSKINSSISGIRVTKAFNNAKLEQERFEEGNKEFIEAKKGQYHTMGLVHASTTFVTELFNVVCLISGGIFLLKGKINFGDYSAFMVSINVFINPILTLINFTEQLHDGMAGFERFCEIMDEPIEKDKETAKDLEKINGDIEFKNVSFSYKTENAQMVLKNVSFKIKKGETLALVGPSGGGKTTICHLLPRFYNCDEGLISIGGVDIQDITMRSLRANIGIVQQDVFLFDGSFKDNIRYGKLTASDDEIIEAAKKANIYDYIMSLPNGFDSQIGERGVRLSGGQKQRLSIARVFLKNPDILILDEATSALDNTTELLIQDSLNALKQGRTTIVVAHRLSTIKNADEILVITNGTIQEKGTHEQLLNKKDGLYKELYKAQFKEEMQ